MTFGAGWERFLLAKISHNIRMKKLFLLVALLPSLAAGAHAAPFEDFRNLATSANLKPFALDLGGVLGGSSFHSGRALGMPGFDVRIIGSAQSRPDRDDAILRDGGVKRFGFPMLQVEAGLPFKVDVIAHGSTGTGAKVVGGGLRYGLHKSAKVSPLPDLAVSFFGDSVSHEYFSAAHYSVNATASVGLPIVKPFIGAGFDHTTVKVKSSLSPALEGTKATARGARFSAGVDVSPMPLLHVHAAASLLHGIPGADLGLGLRF